mgnify:CR=1 FL=1
MCNKKLVALVDVLKQLEVYKGIYKRYYGYSDEEMPDDMFLLEYALMDSKANMVAEMRLQNKLDFEEGESL